MYYRLRKSFRLARKNIPRFLISLLGLGKYFVSIHARPILTGLVAVSKDIPAPMGHPAIVMQGPLIRKNNFTYETLFLYRRAYPENIIIVSTWENERDYVSEIEKLGVKIILNEPPVNPGERNVNYQIVSTKAGIAEAKKLGALHVLKTRTDQRLYYTNTLGLLMALLKTFPLENRIKKQYGQHERLVGVSSDVSRYKLFHFSDQLLFGRVDDLERYWSVELIEGRIEKFKPERYFFTNYLKNIRYFTENSNLGAWKAYAELGLIVDDSMVDLFWYKYNYHHAYRMISYAEPSGYLSFSDWLMLYKHFLDDDPS